MFYSAFVHVNVIKYTPKLYSKGKRPEFEEGLMEKSSVFLICALITIFAVSGISCVLADNGNNEQEINPTTANTEQVSEQTTEDWNPGMMSDEDKEKYGIEAIPRDQVEERGAELGLSSYIIQEFLATGDEFLYFAHDPNHLMAYPVDEDGNRID